jgi:hypothetical protein
MEGVAGTSKKGSKAFTILAPRFVKKEPENGEDETRILAGFLAVAVFRIEDTEGLPLDYERVELPPLPLIDVAQDWGISVNAIPGNYRYFGWFSQERKEISLATKEETVFFHELAHAAHARILGEHRPSTSRSPKTPFSVFDVTPKATSWILFVKERVWSFERLAS